MDHEGRKQVGSAPLRVSPAALASFKKQVARLAAFLHAQGAVGSYGPDFLIVASDETNGTPETSVLLELNARAPATAYALEIVKRIRGHIGAGFLSRHLKLPFPATYGSIADRLDRAGLLIRHPDPVARGVVPYNVGLLPWGMFDVVAMADSWAETTAALREAMEVLGAT
jgi:hypothetical protein